MRSIIITAAKGAAMGMAEVVPGVSGGTIAFITGIYERLLNVIKAIGPEALIAFRKDGIKGLWTALDGTFFASLLGGMVVGIGVGVFLITHLLETYPLQVWSFFFGLIVVSAWFVAKQISAWNGQIIFLATLGAVVAYSITIAAPGAQLEPSLWFVFACGMIAVSALMLPGVSGSYILLLMGMYTYIIPTVKEALKTFEVDKLIILFVFGSGMLAGMVTFSRVLSWTFKNYRDFTLAVLTGFLIGSLNKIWPWQQVLTTADKGEGELVVVHSMSVLPETFAGLEENFFYGTDPHLFTCIAMMVAGFALVFLMERFSPKTEA